MESKTETLRAFQKSFDLAVWLMNHTAKFPKSCRFSLAVRIENAILDVVEGIVVANRRTERIAVLTRVDERLATLRILLRLSHQMRVIAPNSYEYGSKEIDEIGKLLGGWLKQQKSVAQKKGIG
jgi:hypothetical protein